MKSPIILAVVAVAAIGGYTFWPSNQSSIPSNGISAAVAQDADVDTSSILEMSMGDPDAKVTVVEYASFTCPHCRTFHSNVLKELKRDYIDTGKINFVYREVYFDRFGLWGGIVARCGGQERYFGIANLLYEQQSDWLGGGDPTEIAGNLRTVGKTAGLTDEELNACFNDGDKAKAMVALYQKNAAADSIRATPSFVINGELFSNMNYADFSAAIDAKLAE
ncbi:MAG: DsbA family protein [Paracoccaceae bacterium]